MTAAAKLNVSRLVIHPNKCSSNHGQDSPFVNASPTAPAIPSANNQAGCPDMFSYESGLLISFLLWLYWAILLLVSINSTMERNLNRIGQRLSWVTLRPKPLEATDRTSSMFGKIMKFLLITGVGLPFVLLSWVYVALFIAQFIYNRSKDSGTPQVVREFRWRMRNADLTFDQILKELMKVQGEDLANFATFRENFIQELQGRGIHFE
jgi:hypothetical protein